MRLIVKIHYLCIVKPKIFIVMKNILYIAVLVAIFALISCERTNDGTNDVADGTYKCDVGYITLQARIGGDFDSALDSLLKVKTVLPDTPYVVVPEALNVEYNTDDRCFYTIAFKREANGAYLQSPSDVLDTRGNWYLLAWLRD